MVTSVWGLVPVSLFPVWKGNFCEEEEERSFENMTTGAAGQRNHCCGSQNLNYSTRKRSLAGLLMEPFLFLLQMLNNDCSDPVDLVNFQSPILLQFNITFKLMQTTALRNSKPHHF